MDILIDVNIIDNECFVKLKKYYCQN